MIKVDYCPIDFSLFPNGEIKIAPIEVFEGAPIFVELVYENSMDIVNLIFVKKYLDNTYPLTHVILKMDYIPYSRMDRQTKNQMFTGKYFAEFINSLNFDVVQVFDPHSNVVVGILNKVVETELENPIRAIIDEEDIDVIFYPDNGANKKYSEIFTDISIPQIYGNKHRDLDTGAITDYNVYCDMDLSGKTILIVDDLCVKGYTTLFAAKKLKELGAERVVFYCSHCENAIHEGELLITNYVDKIYTTNSLVFEKHPKITVFR